MSLPVSDATLETIRSNVKRRAALRDQRYRGNVVASVKGLGCACAAPRSTPLAGYRRINGYVARTAIQRGLGGNGPTEQPALIPVSDKSALINAVKYFVAARTHKNGIGFIGDAAQAGGAASTGATGAKVGTMIMPGIGTVIGAVVGAVVGWIAGKPKPVRATAEQIAQCRTMATEYLGFAAEYPSTCLPLELSKIKDLTWCGAAIHGGMVKLKDPRFFTGGFDERVAICKQIVRKVYETKVGDTVEISGLSFTDAKGKKINLPGTSFVNKPFTTILELTERVLMPLEVANCAPWGKGACTAYIDIPLIKRTLFDLLGYAARTELPNISEADLRAASQVAQTTGTAAKDVVSAVEQIIQRNVIKGETSALLTGQTDQPGVTAPTPVVPIPPSTAPPTIPGITTQAAADVTALIQQLVAQNASANQATQAALNALAERGTPITPSVTASVQKEVAAQQAGGMSTALLTGGGILAALFLLGRPAKRR